MPVRVLSGLVDVERVVRVLDERDAQPALRQARDQGLDQRRFAAAGPSGEAEGLHTPIIFAPATARTTASILRISGLVNRRLPYSAPNQPPTSTAPTRIPVCHGSEIDLTMNAPASPAIELTRMKGAATAEVCLVPAQPAISSSGLRKMPPPTPVSPESNPRPPPMSMASASGGSRTSRISSPTLALRHSCHAA